MELLVNALALALSSNQIQSGQALAATPGSLGLPPMALAPGRPTPRRFRISPSASTAGVRRVPVARATLDTALLNNVNLSGLLQSLGYDPESAINTALGNLLIQTLSGVTVPVGDIPVLGSILPGPVTPTWRHCSR